MLSIHPEVKYEEDGGPGVADCINVLGRLHVPLSEMIAFLDMLIYNYLIGNADAHAKNYSVIYRNGGARLAPLYDAVSTAVYPELSRDFAMSVAGDRTFGTITRESFTRLARDCGISPKLLLARLDNLSERILSEAGNLADELTGPFPSPVYARVFTVIKNQVDSIVPAS